jgi:SecD/SecF fusion protein
VVDRRFKPKKKPSAARNHVALLILLALLLVASFVMFYPPQEKIKQGLDVQGGLSVIMQATTPDNSAPSAENLEASRQIVERRVNLLGASEASVQVQGSDQLLVQIPGTVDQTQALDTIGQTGVLEFVNLADVSDQADVQTLQSGSLLTDQDINEMLAFETIDASQLDVALSGNRVPAGLYTSNSIDLGGSSSYTTYHRLALETGSYTPIFTGAAIVSVQLGRQSETSAYYSVDLTLNDTATQAFAEVTTELAPTKGKIAILLDGAIQSAPAVQDAITTGQVAITGDYDLDAANSLKTVLESGSLPITLTVINSQVIGPTLGQESLISGVLVAIIGLVLIAIYLIVFYRGIGVLTSLAVAIFALLYLGVLATLSYFGQFTLSLAGIAGIVLAIGVAADSSILVLERFKEEIRMGRSVRASSVTGVRHAIQTSIDADLVTLVSALALFFIAVGSTKGFGLTLALGVICDIVTMLLFKAPLIRLLAPHFISRYPGFWGVREDQQLAEAAGELNRGVAHG